MSTGATEVVSAGHGGLFLSPMPKGVEHKYRGIADSAAYLLFLSPMPKGVEHLTPAARRHFGMTLFYPRCRKALSTWCQGMRIPARGELFLSPMPKGVEHRSHGTQEMVAAFVFIPDAERR